LGSALLNQLTSPVYEVKLTSRRKPEFTGNFEWVYSDLLSGEGLEEAVKDVDVIIHSATSPIKNSRFIEVSGFEKFLSKLQHKGKLINVTNQASITMLTHLFKLKY